MTIQERIKNRRLELGMTLRDVSIKLGIAESSVSRYETGNIAHMGIDKLKALADVLQTTPSYLMGWEEADTIDLSVLDEERKKILLTYYNYLRDLK